MKKRITPLLMVLYMLSAVAFSAQGENYFKEGTRWVIRLWAGPPSTDIYDYEVAIKGKSVVDGVTALNMYETDLDTNEERLFAYIRTEGDKVYFSDPITPEPEWYLAYDFGLQAGESCIIYGIHYIGMQTLRTPPDWYVKCTGFTKWDTPCGEVEVMRLDLAVEEADYNPKPDEIWGPRGIWIMGIGSPTSVLQNEGMDADGATFRVLEVYSGDKMIYSNPSAGISSPVDDSPTVTADKDAVIVNNAAESVAVYRCDGTLIATAQPTEGAVRIPVPASGIYIVKTGNATCKLAVR